MNIDIRTRGTTADDDTKQLIRLRLLYALGRLVRRVGRVGVYLSDENGPRGGVDKRCRVVVELTPGRTAVVEGRDRTLRAAVGRVADRAGEAVRRTLDRARPRPVPVRAVT